jgi:hypothetical protein
MLTKEQILEVLESYTQVLSVFGERGVTSGEYGDIADALLKLQEAVPEEAALQGYITEECPDGYVAKESTSCGFCALSMMANCLVAKCSPTIRQDGKWVIFIRKEDIQ